MQGGLRKENAFFSLIACFLLQIDSFYLNHFLSKSEIFK